MSIRQFYWRYTSECRRDSVKIRHIVKQPADIVKLFDNLNELRTAVLVIRNAGSIGRKSRKLIPKYIIH